MSAFEGTPLNIVLRYRGINAFAIVGVAMEVGIEPTVRHGADLDYIPVIVRDACGAGHEKRDSVQWPASNTLVTRCSLASKQWHQHT
jgi:nicotinamidase-related amidase